MDVVDGTGVSSLAEDVGAESLAAVPLISCSSASRPAAFVGVGAGLDFAVPATMLFHEIGGGPAGSGALVGTATGFAGSAATGAVVVEPDPSAAGVSVEVPHAFAVSEFVHPSAASTLGASD